MVNLEGWYKIRENNVDENVKLYVRWFFASGKNANNLINRRKES
jgi:hypothetical protein